MLCKKPFTARKTIGAKQTFAAGQHGCGQCLPCRINRAREWQLRIMLEAKLHDENSFITLTFSDEELPKDESVNPREMQEFIKRLRYYMSPTLFRFYGVGEYGESSLRPHYHFMLFGIGESHIRIRVVKGKEVRYIPEVELAWGKGFTDAGDLSKDSASYVCKYVVKGMSQVNDYTVDYLKHRHPEFMRCSLKPGIGADYMERVACRIEKYPHLEETIVKELGIGGSKKPLGRYLTQRLARLRGQEVCLYKDAVAFEHEEYLLNNEIGFEERFRRDNVRMHSQLTKHKIHKQRSRL